MGFINRFDLTRIMKEYNIDSFFETGTFRGDGVEYALRSPFAKIISVEIISEIAAEARQKFLLQDNVNIITGDSLSILEKELPKLTGNCLFWLDAHFPGADAGLTAYDADTEESVRLPLSKEVETIRRLRPGFHDVLILDDLRIYEDGPYINGNVPADALPRQDRNTNFIYKNFSATHVILKSYLDEGYILIFPKTKYRLTLLKNLFTGKAFQADHFLRD